MKMAHAISLATELVRLDVLSEDQRLTFLHPIVQHAVIRTLTSAEHDATHRAAAKVLYAERLPAERIAAHAMRLRAAGAPWVVERLREGARAALEAVRQPPRAARAGVSRAAFSRGPCRSAA